MSEENQTEKNNSSDNTNLISSNDQNNQQSINKLDENSNSLIQEANITSLNHPQVQIQIENNDNASTNDNNVIKKDNKDETQKHDEENKEIVTSSSSLFEFPTNLQPEEKKEKNSTFGGFIDQPIQKASNQENADLNKSLNGLFSGIKIKDDELNSPEYENHKTTEPINSSSFTFPTTTQNEENKKEQEKDGFNFFGGFNDSASTKIATDSNQFQFTDTLKEHKTGEDQSKNDEKESSIHSSNEQITNDDPSGYKFSGFESSSGFGFDFNSGIFSSNENNSSFSFKFDDIPASNATQKDEDSNNNTNNNFTFTTNFSDNELNKENQTNDSTFNPFDSNTSSKISVSNSSSSKFPEFIEALNSPVFEDRTKETADSFFCKDDPSDSLEAAYKLLFKDLPSK